MILVSYDGSADAQAAIERAAQLAPGAKATVVTVWEPFFHAFAHTGTFVAGAHVFADSEKIDEASRDAALTTAREGARHATTAGLVAEPRAASCDGDVASTILAAAEDVDADVIVIGTRGLSRVKAFLLGGVSHAVVQHADRAVLLVPSPDLATRRHENLHRDLARMRAAEPPLSTATSALPERQARVV